jgi:hypothetical protein
MKTITKEDVLEALEKEPGAQIYLFAFLLFFFPKCSI